MGYSMDMSKENEKKQLLPEGWREFEILTCDEQISKKGNDMFVLIFADSETKQEEEVYAVSAQGKRWFLKQILLACGIEESKKGNFDWDIPDVLNKAVFGRVEHFDEEWINRNGKTIVSKKHKIVEVKGMSVE